MKKEKIYDYLAGFLELTTGNDEIVYRIELRALVSQFLLNTFPAPTKTQIYRCLGLRDTMPDDETRIEEFIYYLRNQWRLNFSCRIKDKETVLEFKKDTNGSISRTLGRIVTEDDPIILKLNTIIEQATELKYYFLTKK